MSTDDIIKTELPSTVEVPELPPSQDDEEALPTVLNPRPGKKSIYWACYYEYDLDVHPDKKGVARCKICGTDIKCNSGTGGIKKHIGYKHPKELERLERGDGWKIVNDFATRSKAVQPQSPASASAAVHVAPSVHVPAAAAATRPAAAPAAAVAPTRLLSNESNVHEEVTTLPLVGPCVPSNKKRKLPRIPASKQNNNNHTIIVSNEESRSREKHWMDMWITVSRELNRLRKELKEADPETEEDLVEEIRMDMAGLKRKKREVAELLGMRVCRPCSGSKEREKEDEEPEKGESSGDENDSVKEKCLERGEEKEMEDNLGEKEDAVTPKEVEVEKESEMAEDENS